MQRILLIAYVVEVNLISSKICLNIFLYIVLEELLAKVFGKVEEYFKFHKIFIFIKSLNLGKPLTKILRDDYMSLPELQI